MSRDARTVDSRGYLVRALACLRPYWKLVFGAYAVMLVINAVNLGVPLIVRNIVDDGIRAGSRVDIIRGVVFLLSAAAVRGLMTYLSGVWTESASQGVAYDLRNRFHAKIQSLSFAFHDETETGQLLARSVQDVDRIRFLTGRAFLNLIQLGVQIVGVSVAMFFLSPPLAASVVAVIPILAIVAIRFGRTLRPLARGIRDKEAVLTARLEQNLRASRIVRAFGREDSEINAFERTNTDLLSSQRQEAAIRAAFLPVMALLAGVGTIVVLVAGGRMTIAGTVSVGELIAFMTYLGQLLVPIRRFGWILGALAEASASAERIFEILDLDSEVREVPGARDLDVAEGALRFENVSLAYGRHHKVLDGVTFAIEPSEKLAILGTTGSGKSSVVSLVPRFYDPTAGSILIDGIDIRTVTIRSLRQNIGMVFQDTVLFASTVRSNIAFGLPDATDAEIESAARAAHIHEFVVSLPAGYETVVGERGVTLSGGQKQRVSIARAILLDPKILILDDATSSVDTETERQIQDALERLMHGRTSIVIAHRLSTVRTADRVIVLDHGKVAAEAARCDGEDPHEQLLRTSGIYASIFKDQLEGVSP